MIIIYQDQNQNKRSINKIKKIISKPHKSHIENNNYQSINKMINKIFVHIEYSNCI
jgi:ABC-type transport system involved in cytochrome bd biosynthesis fused ATPase/permease subunit